MACLSRIGYIPKSFMISMPDHLLVRLGWRGKEFFAGHRHSVWKKIIFASVSAPDRKCGETLFKQRSYGILSLR